jgi:hypothetical protein
MLELVPTVLKEVIDVIFRHMIYIYILCITQQLRLSLL